MASMEHGLKDHSKDTHWQLELLGALRIMGARGRPENPYHVLLNARGRVP